MTVFLAVVAALPIYDMWREEKSTALEGYLTIKNPVRLKSPHFQIADSGFVIEWGMSPLTLFKDPRHSFQSLTDR